MMSNIPEEMKFDERLVEYERRKGLLKQKEFDAHLKSLPDEEKNAEYFEIEDEILEEESGLTFVSAIMKD
ncbi:MAG: hypothetical protein ABIE74_11245 [Pseudomonadota bacterium]